MVLTFAFGRQQWRDARLARLAIDCGVRQLEPFDTTHLADSDWVRSVMHNFQCTKGQQSTKGENQIVF